MRGGFSLGKLKIALVSEEFPPFAFGGIGSHCFDLANNLSKKKISTTVLCGGLTESMTVERKNKYLEIVRIPCLNLPPRYLWFQVRNLKIIESRLRDQTLIHGVNPQASAACSYLKKRLGKPFITSIHGVPLYNLKGFFNSESSYWTLNELRFNLLDYPLSQLMTEICLRNSDHIVVGGQTALQQMKSKHKNLDLGKFSIIYNGIDFNQISSFSSAQSQNRTNNKVSIICGNRLYLIKGTMQLVKAMAIVKKTLPSVELKIFGIGPLEDKVNKMIYNLGLENNVRLFGYVQREGFLDALQNSDFAALPSFQEVGPFMSALEAMAYGKPVIALDLPFAREFLVSGKNGLLAKPNNIEDLSEKILRLAGDSELRLKLGADAQMYVKRNHNWDFLIDSYLDIYNSVI